MEVLGKYGIQQTFYFPLIDAGAVDFEATPVTHATGDSQVSIDGGSFANTTNAFAHEGNGIYSLVLTAAEMSGTRIVVTIIDQSTKAYEDQAIIINTQFSGQLEASAGIIIGQVDTGTFTASTTALEGLRLSPNATEETTADHYNGRLILFTSGVLLGQMSDITDYALANSKEKFTYTALTEAPGNGDRYVIL